MRDNSAANQARREKMLAYHADRHVSVTLPYTPPLPKDGRMARQLGAALVAVAALYSAMGQPPIESLPPEVADAIADLREKMEFREGYDPWSEATR